MRRLGRPDLPQRHDLAARVQRVNLAERNEVAMPVHVQEAVNRFLAPTHLRADGTARQSELVEQRDPEMLAGQIEAATPCTRLCTRPLFATGSDQQRTAAQTAAASVAASV